MSWRKGGITVGLRGGNKGRRVGTRGAWSAGVGAGQLYRMLLFVYIVLRSFYLSSELPSEDIVDAGLLMCSWLNRGLKDSADQTLEVGTGIISRRECEREQQGLLCSAESEESRVQTPTLLDKN